MQVALCAGEYANSRLVDGVTRYSLFVPIPMGLAPLPQRSDALTWNIEKRFLNVGQTKYAIIK